MPWVSIKAVRAPPAWTTVKELVSQYEATRDCRRFTCDLIELNAAECISKLHPQPSWSVLMVYGLKMMCDILVSVMLYYYIALYNHCVYIYRIIYTHHVWSKTVLTQLPSCGWLELSPRPSVIRTVPNTWTTCYLATVTTVPANTFLFPLSACTVRKSFSLASCHPVIRSQWSQPRPLKASLPFFSKGQSRTIWCGPVRPTVVDLIANLRINLWVSAAFSMWEPKAPEECSKRLEHFCLTKCLVHPA